DALFRERGEPRPLEEPPRQTPHADARRGDRARHGALRQPRDGRRADQAHPRRAGPRLIQLHRQGRDSSRRGDPARNGTVPRPGASSRARSLREDRMQERGVSLSTGELSYFAAGEGRPILYLHPAGGVRWTRVLEGLAKSSALHVPVMPGFDGTSAHGAVKSMRGLAHLVGEFIGKVIAGPCDVIGCSFGGYLAAWLAAEHPELVDHLVLECPAGFRPKGRG